MRGVIAFEDIPHSACINDIIARDNILYKFQMLHTYYRIRGGVEAG
jgi:hypothetical protein